MQGIPKKNVPYPKEILEVQHTLHDGVYVFVAKEKINHISYDTLKKGIIWSLKKLNCVEE